MNNFPKYLKYNQTVTYPLNFKENDITKDFLTNLKISVSPTESFILKTLNIYPDKSSPKSFTSYHQVQNYIKNSTFKKWDNQLKFAIYCATSGCGVSWQNHLNHSNPLVRSIFRFHTYFQIRKILHQLQIPLPNTPEFNKENNPYDKQAYEKLKTEFNVNLDFNYFKIGKIKILDLNIPGQRYLNNPFHYPFRADGLNFVDYHKLPINSLTFQHTDDWTNYIPLNGNGLVNIQRINESIRTYVYCILGAQAMIRHDIVGDSGLAFDSQKQFEILVEDSIQGQTLVDSIKTFQNASLLIRSTESYKNVLEKTKSQLNFAIGPNLQLIPSDMRLHLGINEGYNNSLITADSSMKFGLNEKINPRIKRSIKIKNEKNFSKTIPLENEKIKNENETATDAIEKNKIESHLPFTIGLIL